MEVVARQFVDKMLVEDMISEDDQEWYVYSLQLIIEKLFSVLSLLLISIIMGYFFQRK